jgi:hypothetical protein
MAIRRSIRAGALFRHSARAGVFVVVRGFRVLVRILAAGSSCVYELSACVFHYHRREFGELRHLVNQYMGHVAAFLAVYEISRYRKPSQALVRLPAEYALLVLRLVSAVSPSITGYC